MSPGFTNGIRATFMVAKRRDFSEEEFEKHYTEAHIPMVAEVLSRHGALSYTVVSKDFPGNALVR